MNIPRWTVYPALTVLFALPVAALLERGDDEASEMEGAALEQRGPAALLASTAAPAAPAALPAAKHPRLVILGIDGLDPEILQEAMDRFPDRTKNFRWLAQENGVHSLGTSCPPQSPVAWSNFITGFDPGGHGVFDFIHRSTTTRAPLGSTIKEATGDKAWFEKLMEGVIFWGDFKMPDPAGEENRTGTPFWRILEEEGVPADIWRMPINFPVEPSEGVSFPGMLTPALDSAYGECTLVTTNALSGLDYKKLQTPRLSNGRLDVYLDGPQNYFKEGDPHTKAHVQVYVDAEEGTVALDTGTDVVLLEPGEWSEFVPLLFEMDGPLALGLDGLIGIKDVTGIARFYVRSIEPHFEMYVSPVNISPTVPNIPVSEPSDASEELAEAIGNYYTQGMAEDVNSLKKEVLDVPEFVAQSTLVYEERMRMLDYAVDRYAKNDGGFLFFYFSTVDLMSHMLWRHSDPEHPHHDPKIAGQSSEHWSGRPGSTWQDITHDVILKIDPVLGRLRDRLGDDTTFVVMSDHGFAPYRRKFSLNRWLYEEGYLVLKDGFEPELARGDPGFQKVYIFSAVDWSKTRAYGMGFNGLYLNLAGREGDIPDTSEDESGIVQEAEAEALLNEIAAKLEALRDDDGTQVVLRCDRATQVYHGDRVPEAPDLVVGYNTGYGNSDPASEGRIPSYVLEDNTGGTFNGSHLMAPEVVSGTLMSNKPIRSGAHRLEDLTVEVLGQYGISPQPGMDGHRVLEN